MVSQTPKKAISYFGKNLGYTCLASFSTICVVVAQADWALAASSRGLGRAGVGVGRILARFPEFIIPYLVIFGITFGLTKDVNTSIGMPFLI